MTDKEVTRVEDKDVKRMQAPETDAVYVPDVDICEDDERVLLTADMAGVDETSVDVTVDSGVLTVEGRARVEEPAGYEWVGREYGVGRYRRDFTLSDAVNTEGIKARVRNGVLHLTLPKREAVKTRKIEIEA
jgi:HSP20 family molecular chaperone IbpA